METLLSYNGCRIVIEDSLIKCSYPAHFDRKRWQITLGEKEICYKADEKKGFCFQVDEIREFQFEMGNGGNSRAYQDFPAAIAYVILKSDPDPQDFFYFFINEEYVLLNQTKAYDFCSEILRHLGDRYVIPVNYKLSIDTKKKQSNLIWLPVLFILTFLLIWLRLHFGH
jgi:hypothetical protein